MLKSFVQSVFTTHPTPFQLQDLEGFPYSDWTRVQEHYVELNRWYSGEALNEKIQDKAGNQIDKYPLHINPIPNTCEKHTAVLLGNTLESIRHGGVPVTFIPEGKDTEAAETINDALIKAFIGGGGGSLFVSNGTISQYLGGCVWGVSWRPNNEKFPVQVRTPLPTEFLAYPEGDNYWDLREAWFVREITWKDAMAYGYPVPEIVQKAVMPTDVANSGYNYYYIEHWTKESYSIQCNEMVIKFDGVSMAGTNPFGIVPFVYFPHKRSTTFLGESIITEAMKGIIKEINLRNTDIGEAVNSDAHSIIAVRGVRSSLKAVKLPDGRSAVDLGSSSGLGAGETQPDMIAVRTQSAAAPQLDFTSRLDTMYRVEAKHPAVADGLDEGSQRSSLTLTTRMWPLQSHVELERIEWTTGLLRLAEIILTFCSTKGAYEITKAHLDIPLTIKWATMLPRDRKELVDEAAVRKNAELGSTKHLIQLFGDVDNVEEEMKLIDEDKEKATENALKLKPPPTTQPGENKDPAAPRSSSKEE